MNVAQSSKKLYLYVALAAVLVPLLLIGSELLFPKQINCFDIESNVRSYTLEDGGPTILQSDVLRSYAFSGLFLLVSSVGMLGTGVALLYGALKHRDPREEVPHALGVLFTVIALFGYTFVLLKALFDLMCSAA